MGLLTFFLRHLLALLKDIYLTGKHLLLGEGGGGMARLLYCYCFVVLRPRSTLKVMSGWGAVASYFL